MNKNRTYNLRLDTFSEESYKEIKQQLKSHPNVEQLEIISGKKMEYTQIS